MLNIIKIGGNVIDNPTLRAAFLTDFATLTSPKILVHGGGKIATQMAVKLDIETTMIEGRRITDAPMLDVVTMVYAGLVNKQLVAALQALGCNAFGLTGADGGVVRSKKRTGWELDYGFVGDIESVDYQQISNFIKGSLTPIFAPLTLDVSLPSLLNTNADTLAQAIAVGMASDFEVNLVYCFEKKGVLQNPEDDSSAIPLITPALFERYKADGTVSAGMIPKLDNAFRALHSGVKQVTICHATDLTDAVTHQSAGTRLTLTGQ